LSSQKWKNKFSHVSIDIQGNLDGVGLVDIAAEGMNEAGLTVSALTFREAGYQTPRGSSTASQVCVPDGVSWMLGTFGSVADLTAELRDPTKMLMVGVRPKLPLPSGDTRFHWSVDDAHGHHVVIEYVNGELQLHNNTAGVCTNDPEYSWHLRNLNQFVNLSPQWPTGGRNIGVQTEIGVVPTAIGHGFNLLGMPADYSPASRFVRLFYQRQYAMLNYPVKDINSSIALVSGVLNTVFITKGVVASAASDIGLEFTQYTVLKLPQKLQFYFKDYENTQWRKLDLKNMDMNASASLPLSDGTMGVRDVSADFR